VTDDEYRELVAAIRATRIAATQAELRRPRRASASVPISAHDLGEI
jgi:hypothetical protein